MAFIRKRISPTRRQTPSYQLVESYREDGKVKQWVLANLGRHPTVEEALAHARKRLGWAERRAAHCEKGIGRRFHRISEKAKADARERLQRAAEVVEKLEAVVSETSRRRDLPDTTPLGKARRSVVRLAIAPTGSIANRMSGLQAGILKALFLKRVPGARGCDASNAELLAELWGWEPRRRLRWAEQDVDPARPSFVRAGDPMPHINTYRTFPRIPRADYRSAHASLARALTRLHKRGLVEYVCGTWGTYGGGPVLTTAGEHVARRLAYPTAERVDVGVAA